MKLPIKGKYFDMIKRGEKDKDYRDAHITFLNIDTGEELTKNIVAIKMIGREEIPEKYLEPGLYDDDIIIEFHLSDREE